MKVAYFGYRQWAFKILRNLLKKRSSKWQISDLITTAHPEKGLEKLSLPLHKINPSDKKALAKILRQIKPDILLVYGWSWIIPREIFNKYLTLILHTSPLPKYRGGSPLQHQILAGEKISAVSIFQADTGIDTGDIYAQKPFSLEGKLDDIFKRIISSGTRATFEVLNRLTKGKIIPVSQDNSKATSFKRRKPEESEITIKDLKNKTSEELYNFIRALEDPYPNAYIICKDGKKLFLNSACLEKP